MFFRLYLPPGSGRLRQPATIDPTLNLCTRYPLRLGGPRQCGIRSLPNTSTHGQHWESNPRPSDLESNALSTWPHVPMRQKASLHSNCNAPTGCQGYRTIILQLCPFVRYTMSCRCALCLSIPYLWFHCVHMSLLVQNNWLNMEQSNEKFGSVQASLFLWQTEL